MATVSKLEPPHKLNNDCKGIQKKNTKTKQNNVAFSHTTYPMYSHTSVTDYANRFARRIIKQLSNKVARTE